MFIVLSPAKTLDFEAPIPSLPLSEPQYLAQSSQLIKVLREKSPEQIQDLMRISPALAQLNHTRYQQWEKDHTETGARPAIFAFKGDVYQGFEVERFSEEDLLYAQRYLRVLSGLYGLLRPLDLIYPYRLEMGTRLKHRGGSDLYSFWGDRLAATLVAEAHEQQASALVNLASVEYFSVLKNHLADLSVVNPVFKDYSKGQYKIISFFAKRARGLMASWILRQKVLEPSALCEFDEAGYRFAAAESSELRPVFTRRSSS